MKNILTLLLLASYIASYAQETEVFDTSFANTTSVEFFKKNPVIESLNCSIDSGNIGEIHVYFKTTWQDTSFKSWNKENYTYYNLGFIGDRYFFEKKYGRIESPVKNLNVTSWKKCKSLSYINCTIKADSIKCKFTFLCPYKENDDEIVFTKTEILAGYKNGISELQNQIWTSYRKSNLVKQNKKADQAFLFTIVIDNKDSCLKRIELTEGNYSPIAQFIIDQLRTACSWTPSIMGGRPVKSYRKIFVNLNKGKNIEVYMN